MNIEQNSPDARLVLRVALWTLAGSSALIGALAAFAPHAFYTSFPAGLSWVAKLPPYNQHLTTDVGGFYLGFALLFAWAAVRLARPLVVPLATAWILVETLHLGYHLAHLDGFGVADAVAQTATFAVLIVLPMLVLRLTVPQRVSGGGPR
jgi:hypothetical protein